SHFRILGERGTPGRILINGLEDLDTTSIMSPPRYHCGQGKTESIRTYQDLTWDSLAGRTDRSVCLTLHEDRHHLSIPYARGTFFLCAASQKLSRDLMTHRNPAKRSARFIRRVGSVPVTDLATVPLPPDSHHRDILGHASLAIVPIIGGEGILHHDDDLLDNPPYHLAAAGR
ncbi:MAG: hypothetical protein SVX28_03575, partial [Pseudomonadota bacterium]|nr:hypothetical protein [Pseudomonadota bacterium]